MKIQDAACVITGASKGLGAALGEELYKHYSIERKEDRFVIALNRELVSGVE